MESPPAPAEPSPPKRKEVSPENLQRCLALLDEETSDEEKFAGLLLVTKVIDPDDLVSLATVFERISWGFIRRLMATKHSTPDLPAELLHQIAVSVVSAFAAHEEMAAHERILALVPLLKDLLQTSDSQPASPHRDHLQQEVLSVLNFVSRSPQGAQQILLCDLLKSLRTLLGRDSITTSEENITFILSITQNLYPDQHLMPKHHQDAMAIVAAVAPIFKQNQQQLKFKILDFLVSTLSFLARVREQGNEKQFVAEMYRAREEAWPWDISLGLRDILMSKIGTAQREPAILAVFFMMNHFGPSWLFTEVATGAPEKKAQDQGKPHRFVSVTVNIVCVEARILLEDQDLSKVTHEAGQKLVIYFEILEMVVHHLSIVIESKGPSKDTLEADSLVQLKDAMEITFGALVDFLLPVNDQVLFGNFTEVVDNHVVLACLRILSVWITEGDAHMEGAITLLPLFLKVCKHSENSSHLFTLLTPVFLQMSMEEKSRDPFVEQGGMLLIAEHTCTMLEQIKALPEKGLTTKEVTKLQLPLELLLNVAMLSPAAMKKDHTTFLQLSTTLLEFTSRLTVDISSAKSLPISLLGSAVLLILSSIRSIQDLIPASDIDAVRVLQATHFFLKSGLGCKLSKSPEASEIWPDISEVWFLCLKVLSDCLPVLVSSPPSAASLGDLLSLLDSAPPSTFSSDDLQYLTLLRDKATAVLPKIK